MRPQRQGFTLVELVVVIMILGILAGVAAPKFFDTSKTAAENSLKQTLAVVRNAIELYSAQNNGALPAGTNDADFKDDLSSYLRGPFPSSPVGQKNNTVAFGDTATGSSGSWMYDDLTGDFFCNETATDSNGDAYSTY